MAMNDFNIGFIGGLDETKSKAKLNQDIDAIKKTLKELELKAKLDPNQVKSLETQLNTLKVNLTDAKFSQSALDGMVSQINNALKGIKIPSISVGGNANIGQQIGNNIAQGFKQSATAIEAFKKSLSNAGKSSSEIDNIVKKVQSLNVQIDSLRFSESTNGLMNVNVAGLDEFGNKVKITQTLLQDLQTMQWNVSNTTTSVISTKELERINNAFTDYTAKLAQFKSTNTNILSGLTQPLADFESKLAGLKNGTVSIDEVKNAFKLLGTEASKITENFTGQLSKTDAAIRKLAQGDEIMDKLKASFKGLNNAPKEITKELNSVSKLLQNVKNIESKEGRTANWSEAYRKWADEVDKLQAKLSVLQKQQASMTTPQIFKTSELKNADIPYMTKVSNTIEKQMAEIQKMANAKGWKKFEVKGVEETDGKIKALTLTVRDAEGALKQFTMQRAKLQGSGKAQTGLMQVGDVKVLETASQAQAKLAQQTENANAKLQEQLNKIQHSLSVGDYDTQLKGFETALKKAGVEGTELENALKGAKTAFDNLNKSATTDNITPDDIVKNARLLDIEIEKLKNNVKNVNLDKSLVADDLKVNNTVTKLNEQLRKNTAYSQKAKNSIKSWIRELESGDVAESSLKAINSQAKQLHAEMAKGGKIGLNWWDKLKQAWEKFGGWSIATTVFMKITQSVKQMVLEVKTLDNAMMDLTMATGYNKDQIEDLMNTYFKLGDQLSATASDVAASADTWLRQGKSIAETNKLIEDSMILSKIGGLSSEDSTKYLTSVMKGYKVATEDVIGVVDKLSAVDMASATDVGGLAEGMSEVAASADLAGVSMDKLLGYLAAIGETTQSGMGEVGTTLNAVFARMGNIKLARLKDYQNNGEDLSNVETVLRGVGITLRDSVNSFRDFDDVLDETASNWTNYSEVQQRAIASAFAGTHHMNEFIVLMENYDTALKYTKTSLDSTGQAMDKFEAYEESIAGHTEKFKNAFQNLSNTVVDSELINFFIDLGTFGIKALDGLVQAVSPLGIALGGLTVFINRDKSKQRFCPLWG